MNLSPQYWEVAERFVRGGLSQAELHQLHQHLDADAAFSKSFQECVDMLQDIDASASRSRFRAMVEEISCETATPRLVQQQQPSLNVPSNTIPLKTHYWRTAAIAASISVITSVSAIWFSANNQKQNASRYDLLRREVETIKTSQKQIITNINSKKHLAPSQPAAYAGTGFAISNNGFIATNYHVTAGADSIYILDNKGRYYRANLVSFDKANDVAVLQAGDLVNGTGQSEAPYSFAKAKKPLGARVFTLGFPQEEVVYNEGYISSKNGFQGDTMQYLLELPASFGQSGAPVLDASGSIIGIVTARQGNAGATYAVCSRAIMDLIKNLPPELGLQLPKTNKLAKYNREQQIKKLEDYTFQVRVYKR